MEGGCEKTCEECEKLRLFNGIFRERRKKGKGVGFCIVSCIKLENRGKGVCYVAARFPAEGKENPGKSW